MVKGCKVVIKVLFGKVNKEWHATVFRIYYSGFMYKATACILHSRAFSFTSLHCKAVLLIELMTNNMLEEVSNQSQPIYYSTAATKKG